MTRNSLGVSPSGPGHTPYAPDSANGASVPDATDVVSLAHTLAGGTLQGAANALRTALSIANERLTALEAELIPLKETCAGLQRALDAVERVPVERVPAEGRGRLRYVQTRPVGSVVQALREWADSHGGIVDARELSTASGIDRRGIAGAARGLVTVGEFVQTANGLYRRGTP